MAEMTSRERGATTLRHEEPDRVPLDIGGGNSTTLLVETYENLKEHIGKSAPTRIMNKAFRSSELDEDVMVRLGSDVRSVRTKAPKNWAFPIRRAAKSTICSSRRRRANSNQGSTYRLCAAGR